MLNRRAAPSALPSARKRSPEEQSNLDLMYELAKERRSLGELGDDGYYFETNANRIKRGVNRELTVTLISSSVRRSYTTRTALPPRGFSLQEVGGTLRYLPDQKPSQTIKPEDTEETHEAVVRTGEPLTGSQLWAVC